MPILSAGMAIAVSMITAGMPLAVSVASAVMVCSVAMSVVTAGHTFIKIQTSVQIRANRLVGAAFHSPV